MGVSYPLSLYRDIHKLSRASGLALVGMIIIVASVLILSKNEQFKKSSFSIDPVMIQS